VLARFLAQLHGTRPWPRPGLCTPPAPRRHPGTRARRDAVRTDTTMLPSASTRTHTAAIDILSQAQPPHHVIIVAGLGRHGQRRRHATRPYRQGRFLLAHGALRTMPTARVPPPFLESPKSLLRPAALSALLLPPSGTGCVGAADTRPYRPLMSLLLLLSSPAPVESRLARRAADAGVASGDDASAPGIVAPQPRTPLVAIPTLAHGVGCGAYRATGGTAGVSLRAPGPGPHPPHLG
jgi:hypothetical protein